MEIEILTTKKKISKSIIKQLGPASLADMTHFNSQPTIGYYIRDLGPKYPPVVLLFEGINGWKILASRSWKSAGDMQCIEAPASEVGLRGTTVRKLKSREIRDEWLAQYNEVKKSCLKNHLII